MAAPRNMLSGYAEPAHINDFMFEQQRRTFATYGKVIRLTVSSLTLLEAGDMCKKTQYPSKRGYCVFLIHIYK